MINTALLLKKEQTNGSALDNKKRIERRAKAHWSGNLKEGTGTLTTQSGMLDNTYFSFNTRFHEGAIGTNPEELLAASLAACFTMSVCEMLSKKELPPSILSTETIVFVEGQKITKVHLSITARIPELSLKDFQAIVKNVEKNSMISKILTVPISSEIHFCN